MLLLAKDKSSPGRAYAIPINLEHATIHMSDVRRSRNVYRAVMYLKIMKRTASRGRSVCFEQRELDLDIDTETSFGPKPVLYNVC